MAEELVDVLLEIPDEVERAPSVGVVVAVRAAAVGGGLVHGQQVLLLQTLEMGKPLSVLSLAPLPAIHQENLCHMRKAAQAKPKRRVRDWIRLDIC